jgi:hypothetical protein
MKAFESTGLGRLALLVGLPSCLLLMRLRSAMLAENVLL